jgi:hypothetical protein
LRRSPAKRDERFFRPSGTRRLAEAHSPALKRWIFGPGIGCLKAEDEMKD